MDELDRDIAEVREIRKAAEVLQQKATEATRGLVERLIHEEDMSLREVAEVFGLSKQRIFSILEQIKRTGKDEK